MFKECIGKLEAKYTEAWKASKTVEAREDAHRYMMLIEWFVHDFQSIANTGNLEKMRSEALATGYTRPKLAEFNR